MRTAACGLYDLFPGMTAFLQGWMNTTPKTLPGGKKGQDKGVLTMKKTKIICTLGPATDRKEILVKMIESGMDLARFNFSHGSHEECAKRLALLKEAIAETGRVIGFIGDTKGPEMRLGLFKGDKVTLKDGDAFTLTAEACEGTAEKAHVNYSGLPQEVKKGDTILLNDGKLTLRVESTTDTEIHTTVTNGGEISSRKRVAVQGLS